MAPFFAQPTNVECAAGRTGAGFDLSPNAEVKKARDASAAGGARRLRRFAVRRVVDVRKSQMRWTLKRPEGRAPCAPHDATSEFGLSGRRRDDNAATCGEPPRSYGRTSTR